MQLYVLVPEVHYSGMFALIKDVELMQLFTRIELGRNAEDSSNKIALDAEFAIGGSF